MIKLIAGQHVTIRRTSDGLNIETGSQVISLSPQEWFELVTLIQGVVAMTDWSEDHEVRPHDPGL